MNSGPPPLRSMAAHERRSGRKPPPRLSTRSSRRLRKSLLRRPVESAQYLSIRYTERLAGAGIDPSVGSVGDSHDNALAERINGLFRAEVIHRRGPWRSCEAVEYATFEWVDRFNHCRFFKPIGSIPPVQAETNFYAAIETQAAAA